MSRYQLFCARPPFMNSVYYLCFKIMLRVKLVYGNPRGPRVIAKYPPQVSALVFPTAS